MFEWLNMIQNSNLGSGHQVEKEGVIGEVLDIAPVKYQGTLTMERRVKIMDFNLN
jgi:hypothetical protein